MTDTESLILAASMAAIAVAHLPSTIRTIRHRRSRRRAS